MAAPADLIRLTSLGSGDNPDQGVPFPCRGRLRHRAFGPPPKQDDGPITETSAQSGPLSAMASSASMSASSVACRSAGLMESGRMRSVASLSRRALEFVEL